MSTYTNYIWLSLLKLIYWRVSMNPGISFGITCMYIAQQWSRHLWKCSSFHGKGRWCISSPQRPYQLWGPPSLLLSGYQGHFLRVEWSGNLADHHSPLSSAKIKNEWSYIFTFPTCLYCMQTKWSVKTHSYLTPSCPPEMGTLRLQRGVTVEKGKFFQSLSPRFQQSITEETRKFFESHSPKGLALMPMQRRLVWPAAWLTSVWHVADKSLCRSRGYNDSVFYGIPPLSSNERSDSTMKHWQYHEALTNFLISLNL